MVLTHPHHDHLAGLVEVLRRYRVKQVLHPNLDDDSPLYDEWRSLIEEKGIQQTIVRAGQQIDLGGGVLIRVLNPQTTLLVDTESDIDNNGVVSGQHCPQSRPPRLDYLHHPGIPGGG